MGIAAVRDGKLAIAVCIMHICVLLSCAAIIVKTQPARWQSGFPVCPPEALSRSAWWSMLGLLFCGSVVPVVGYILMATHISLFKDLLHHAALAVASLLLSFLLLPSWYHGVLWPIAVRLAASPKHKDT